MAKGRWAQLDAKQLDALRAALLQGAMAHDFGAELWTLKRVRALIERLYGVRFSEMHVWRLLRAMGFSSQMPERRAIERNEAVVLAWKRKTWPALTESAAQRRLIVFINESSLSEWPTRVRAWAPKGRTPVVQLHFNWKHISAIAGLTRSNFLFWLYDGPVKERADRGVLGRRFRAQLRRKLLIVWDGAAQHKSRVVREYLDSTNGALQMALLPAYAPDLNPVEYLWARLKRHALASFFPRSLAELKSTARNKLRSGQRRQSIITACWKQAELW